MREENSSIDVAICIDSQIFTRGLIEFLRELFGERVRISIYEPKHACSLIDSEAKVIILDALLALPVLKSLPDCMPKRVILVSEKSHPGLELEGQEKKICGFFSARADESRLKQDLQSIMDCPVSRETDPTICEQCPSRRAYLAATLPLSQRELEIFEMVGRLLTTADIAESLAISPKTLESHYSNIKHKLKLSTSRELLKAAVDWVEGR